MTTFEQEKQKLLKYIPEKTHLRLDDVDRECVAWICYLFDLNPTNIGTITTSIKQALYFTKNATQGQFSAKIIDLFRSKTDFKLPVWAKKPRKTIKTATQKDKSLGEGEWHNKLDKDFSEFEPDKTPKGGER